MLLMCDIMIQNGRQCQYFRLVVYKRQHINGKGVLKLGILIKLIEQNLRIDIAAIFYHNTHTLSAGFVTQLGNTVYFFVLYTLCNGFAKHTFVYTERNLGKNNASVVFLNACARAHHNVTFSGCIRLFNSVNAVNGCIGRKIGTFDKFHQIVNRAFRMIHTVNSGINHFSKIVRRDICRHTNGNTHGAVYQKVGEARRQHRRFLQTVIEVWHHGHNIFIQITHHFICNAIQPCFGITVCSRRVSVDRAEVSVTFYQRIAQRKWLCHTYHGAVNSRIAVRMVTSQNITDCGCRFSERLGMNQTVLIHCI